MKKLLVLLLIVSMLATALTACESPKNNVNTDDTALTEAEMLEKYNAALALINEKKYADAHALLCEINTYGPAQEKLKNFLYAPRDVTAKWKYQGDVSYRTDTISYFFNAQGNITSATGIGSFSYDANGNLLKGKDLIYGTEYTYSYYSDGKLYQKYSTDERYEFYYGQGGKIFKIICYYSEGNKMLADEELYYYNQNGDISKIVYKYANGSKEEINYQYTYHANGKIAMMMAGNYMEYHYNEIGQLVKMIAYEYGKTTITFTYGKYGLTNMNVDEGDRTSQFTYTYDSVGKLVKLEVKEYEDSSLYATYIYTFSGHYLYYSENPSVQERIAIINFTDMNSALEIIW